MLDYPRGSVYREVQKDTGRLTRSGKCQKTRIRWVAELQVDGFRYRFRSTNKQNVETWLGRLRRSLLRYPAFHNQKSKFPVQKLDEITSSRAVRFAGGFKKGYYQLSLPQARNLKQFMLTEGKFSSAGNFYASMRGSRMLTRSEAVAVVEAFNARGIFEVWDD